MTGHIFIYGPIGTDKGEISLKNIQNQIDHSASEYELHFRSEGGDVDEGFAIYNYLNELKKQGKKIPRAINESICASIATLIADVADEIIMMEKSQFMIHNPKITQLSQPSDAKNLRAIANRLDGIKTLLIAGYQRRTGLPTEELWELYDNETWLNPSRAVQLGFASAVEPALKAVAKVNINKHSTMEKRYENIFARFLNMFKGQKVKNEMMETLEDGRAIIVLTDTEDWTGKQIMLEDGSPLEPGDYMLAGGKMITVGDNSTITEVKEAEMPENKENETQNTEEDMEKDKKIAELEAQLATLKGEKEAADAKAQAAEARAAKVENRVQTVEKQFLELKEEMSKSFGDTSRPPKGVVVNKFSQFEMKEGDVDPMGEFAMEILKGRNRI